MNKKYTLSRSIGSLLYYFVGYYLPETYFPGGKIFSSIRVWFGRFFLKSCGQHVKISARVFFGNGRDVEIGDHVDINERCRIRNVKIGNYVMIAPEVIILASGHHTSDVNTPMIFQAPRYYPQTVIEDDVWIGARVLILPGRCIGKGSIVAAGSVVVKDVEAYSVVGGNPARVIKSRKIDLSQINGN